jgi:hypothetical protein
MPLSPTVTRKPLHSRNLALKGYHRDDGLLDIEGHLVDTKPFDIPNIDRGGQIRTGESLHEMWVRLTLDENLQVVDAEAVTDWAPFNHCQGAIHSFRNLIGLRIAPGWNSQVKAVLGGNNGCTHITEMLAQMATTAFQALNGLQKPGQPTDAKQEKPAILDTCFGLATDGPVVAREWPEFYRPKDEEKAS